jgi:hypothetical protein
MTTKTKSQSLDSRSPVVMPGDEKITHTPVKPPSQRKPKRKPRSDKGKKRTSKVDKTPVQDEPLNGVELSKEAKRLKKLYKPFDEYKKSDNWLMQVWPCWNNFDKYEIRFVFDGVRYGYKQTFDDASLAVALGTQYLDHRYKNKASYAS